LLLERFILIFSIFSKEERGKVETTIKEKVRLILSEVNTNGLK
jgi:hypothetical protein